MNPFEPPTETEYTVLNLGAGVQSSCLALMCERGEITPKPDFAVFADTGAEPDSVYKWLDWLESQLSFPVICVSYGSLLDVSLTPVVTSRGPRKGETRMRRDIPLFGMDSNGKQAAALGRSCTADYKIRPIIREIKRRCGVKRGSKDLTVTQMIGISYDEMQRMKDSNQAWTQHRWPLIEQRIRRHDCIAWMRNHGYPEPPRSACFFCPFHSDEEWRRLRDDEPHEFERAIKFDHEIREGFRRHPGQMRMEVYLHKSCKPLSEIDFDNDEDKGQETWDFLSECEGMCGV